MLIIWYFSELYTYIYTHTHTQNNDCDILRFQRLTFKYSNTGHWLTELQTKNWHFKIFWYESIQLYTTEQTDWGLNDLPWTSICQIFRQRFGISQYFNISVHKYIPQSRLAGVKWPAIDKHLLPKDRHSSYDKEHQYLRLYISKHYSICLRDMHLVPVYLVGRADNGEYSEDWTH